jgi:mRNA interferase HigB
VILIGEDILHHAAAKHPDATTWINNWISTTRLAEWQSIIDVRRDFPSADGVKLSRGIVVTVFNVSGNKYRVLTVIGYSVATVQVRQFLTYAEYSKQNWKR